MILYVEDNKDSLKLVSRVLSASGYVIHGVNSGMAALEFVETHTPDLILMDINLPGTDGFTMTQQLRQLDKLTDTPIIALTANVMRADQEKSLAAGCDGFIQKPINVDKLPEQIQTYLAKGKQYSL